MMMAFICGFLGLALVLASSILTRRNGAQAGFTRVLLVIGLVLVALAILLLLFFLRWA